MKNSCCGSSGLVYKNVCLRLHITLKLDSKMVVSLPSFPFGYCSDTLFNVDIFHLMTEDTCEMCFTIVSLNLVGSP